jgi:predicted phage terminase large subunit-like protein
MLELEQRRKLVGEYSWASLFQGRPVPRGSRLYGEPTYYDALPTEGYRVVYGLDLAYTAKTSADWTVCVKLLVTGRRHLARAYVADVRRLQVEAPQSGAMLAKLLSVAPGPIWWHGSGPEKGSAQLFNQSHLNGRLRLIATTMDKFTRALDSSEAWNDGRILVPRQASWLAPFLGVVMGFTGVNDDVDDDVDALGSGWAAGQVSTGSYSRFRRHKGVPSRL